MAIPHGVGSVWAQAYWEVYWKLVDFYGFSPDLANATAGSGNQRAMLYFNEGLQNSICRPAFTDLRDAIIAATVTINAGADTCRVWSAFASFGLGADASSGGPDGLAPLNGFLVPAVCNTATPATMVSPTPGSTLPGSTATFSWTTGSGVSQYWLYVGSSFGSADIYSASQGTATSRTLTTLPTDGRTLYVRLWSLINGSWQFRDYTYRAAVRPRPGAWYNPARSGNGFGLTVTSTGEYAMVWYTYRPDGTPVWYLSDTGPASGATWSRPLREYTWTGSSAVGQQVGQVSLSLSDPEHATFTWTLHSATDSEPFQLLLAGEGRTGLWYAPSESGWGLEVWEQGATIGAVVTAATDTRLGPWASRAPVRS